MNLVEQVVSIIEEDGQGTCDTVWPQCPGYTRVQVQGALSNAKAGRQLATIGTIQLPTGARMMVYGPAPDLPDTPPRKHFPRVASVWELGEALR